MARIGMKYVVAAPITQENSGSAITYGAGVVVGRATQGNLTWNRNTNPLYGDDIIAENDNGITGYSLEIGVTEMLETVEAAILGYVADATDTTLYEITDASAPYVGIGYIQVLRRFGQDLYKAVWYHKAQFGINQEQTQTKQEQIQWQTPVMTGTGMGVYNDATGRAKYRQQKVFTGATGEAQAKAWLDGLANI